MPTATLRALLTELIDYAGLFPPAGLDMPRAVANYASYLRGDDAWALGRFVLPASRLDEFARAADAEHTGTDLIWRLSAVIGANAIADAALINAWNARWRERFIVDVAEVKAHDRPAITQVTDALAGVETVYVELPVADDPGALLGAVRERRARAKIRTGGVVPEAIPPTARVARFIARCAELALPFKVTAGLHHPLSGEYALTYAEDAPRAAMFGFLNVFLAAALARSGVPIESLVALLDERNAGALRMTDDTAIEWRSHLITCEQISRMRESFALAFGSCSFREPIDDLHQLGLL
jgi:hypothetical protein